MPASCPFHAPNPFDPAFVQNPWPTVARARAEAPVCYIENLDLWLVTRYQDVRQVLRDPETFSNANVQDAVNPISSEAVQVLKDGGFNPVPTTVADPPLHTRIRREFTRVLGFTPPRLAKLRPWIHEQVSRLIDSFAHRGFADLHQELTAPLPARVVFHLIGFPPEDTDKLSRWAATRLKMSFGIVKPEEQVATAHDMVNYWNYCIDFVRRSMDSDATNVTTELLRVHKADPEAITIKEIESFLYGLIVAGHETTNHAMGSSIRLLLEDRSRWEAVRANRKLIPEVFEEALRLEPPIVTWRRIATRDTELGGVALPRGSKLLLHLGSTGHDEAVFEDSEHFQLPRSNVRSHMAFGNGIHFCLGAPLARLEGEIVLGQLLDRFPDLALVPGQDFEYEPILVIRGPKRLQVQWIPAR